MVVFLNFHFLILNTTHLNNNNKLKKKNDYIKIIIIKLRDKEHHTFSYGPNLLLKLSTSHILHSYHLSHSHIQFTSEKREERERERKENLKRRWRSWCTDRRPTEIKVTKKTELVEIGVH